MKILLVEDDREIAALLWANLTAHRYTVDLASDGQLALELLMQWDYDLIVLLTAKALASDRRRFAAIEVAGVIIKPFNSRQVWKQVAEILGWSFK